MTWGLSYNFEGAVPRPGVYGYYDAAHGDDPDTRRSTMGYIFFFEGCLLSWRSKGHSFVTTSTNHSEYVCSAIAAREAKSLWKLFNGLGFGSAVAPVDLFSDSLGNIAMNYNPENRAACKHADLADHYAREQVAQGIITIAHVPAKDMLADALTKPVGATLFLKLLKLHVRPANRWGGV